MDLSKPPADLTPEARAFWRAHAPERIKAGLLSAADLPAWRTLCVVHGEIVETERYMASLGPEHLYTKTANGCIIEHPCGKRLAALRKESRALLKAFGMLPGARRAVKPTSCETPKNALTEFHTKLQTIRAGKG
jgi:phage terminase small subunit